MSWVSFRPRYCPQAPAGFRLRGRVGRTCRLVAWLNANTAEARTGWLAFPLAAYLVVQFAAPLLGLPDSWSVPLGVSVIALTWAPLVIALLVLRRGFLARWMRTTDAAIQVATFLTDEPAYGDQDDWRRVHLAEVRKTVASLDTPAREKLRDSGLVDEMVRSEDPRVRELASAEFGAEP